MCRYRNKSQQYFQNSEIKLSLDISIYSESDLEECFKIRPKGKSDAFRKLVTGT